MSSAEVLTVEGVDIGLVDILALGSATESLKLSGFSIPVLSSCVEGKGAREPSAMTG